LGTWASHPIATSRASATPGVLFRSCGRLRGCDGDMTVKVSVAPTEPCVRGALMMLPLAVVTGTAGLGMVVWVESQRVGDDDGGNRCGVGGCARNLIAISGTNRGPGMFVS
jgi:hypothetical protein